MTRRDRLAYFAVVMFSLVAGAPSFLNAAEASLAGKSGFIGFNGGASATSNSADFEEEVAFFRDGFFKGQGTVLNAAGPSSRVIPLDDYGFYDRNIFGDITLRPSKIVNSIEANQTNLVEAVNRLVQQKPTDATLVFDDHGGPNALSAWNSKISYATIQGLAEKFPADTVVRRIHMHCYSGAALVPANFNAKTATEEQLLKAYPANRCAFSAAKEDEFSYGANFLEPGPDGQPIASPFEKLKAKRPAPSLADLKTMLSGLASYPSTPQLTSDYFMRDLLQRECAKPRELACSKFDSLETQMRRLNPIVSRDICDRQSSLDQQDAQFKRDSQDAIDRNDELQGIKYRAAFNLAKDRNPVAYASWKRAQEAKEALVKCRVVPSPDCRANQEKLQAEAKNEGSSFFDEKLLSMTGQKPFSPDKLTRDWKRFVASDPILQKKIGLAFNADESRQAGQPVKGGYKAFEFAVRMAGMQVSTAQSKRKAAVLRAQDEIRDAVTSRLMDGAAGAEMKARFLNIRACETSPISH